jgi:hypothetical protein
MPTNSRTPDAVIMPRANSANCPSGPFVPQLANPSHPMIQPSLTTKKQKIAETMNATVALCVSCEPSIDTLTSITPNSQ